MADYPYALVPAKLKAFLAHIQTAGVPAKVTRTYLEQSGFKSKADRQIIPVLKFVGFLDTSGAPSSYWQHYRNKKEGGAILAKAVSDAYAELFSMYPDAYRKDAEALRNFFSTHTKVGDRALQAIVATFQTLCAQADFGADVPEVEVEAPAPAMSPTQIATSLASVTRTRNGVTINVNIEIGVPPTDDPKIYDNFFAALRKHILT